MRDKYAQSIYCNVDTRKQNINYQRGEGIIDIAKKVATKVASKLTGKTATKIASKAAEKVVEKGTKQIGDKTGHLIGEKICSIIRCYTKKNEIIKILQNEKPKTQKI